MVLWAAYSVLESKGAVEQLTQNHLLSRGGARGSEILDASPPPHRNLTCYAEAVVFRPVYYPSKGIAFKQGLSC